MSAFNCRCGFEWELEQHSSEGHYRGTILCGVCKAEIISWAGAYYYSIKKTHAVKDETTGAFAPDPGKS